MKRGDITEIQSFAMSLLFRALNENVINRTWDEYERIRSRIPKDLKVVCGLINDELRRYASTDEFKTREFCRFKAGHNIIRYERYPTSISSETVRQALINFGWRTPRR